MIAIQIQKICDYCDKPIRTRTFHPYVNAGPWSGLCADDSGDCTLNDPEACGNIFSTCIIISAFSKSCCFPWPLVIFNFVRHRTIQPHHYKIQLFFVNKQVIFIVLKIIFEKKKLYTARYIKTNCLAEYLSKCYVTNKSVFLLSNHCLIVAVTETWVRRDETKSTIADISPLGYSFFHEPRAGQRAGGGVGILVSDQFIFWYLSSAII